MATDPVLASLEQLQQEFEHTLPPVDQWHPDLNGDLDMRIDREGRWFYLGSQITRAALVKLFSSILRREGSDHYLVTPVEKWRIRVDAEPFLATTVRAVNGKLVFQTNIGNEIVADDQHALTVTEDADGNPYPTLVVQRQLTALVSRSAFYQLVDMAVAEQGAEGEELVLYSGPNRFVLGRV